MAEEGIDNLTLLGYVTPDTFELLSGDLCPFDQSPKRVALETASNLLDEVCKAIDRTQDNLIT